MTQFLPTIPTAPATNRLLVTSPERDNGAYQYTDGRERSDRQCEAQDLMRKQEFASAIGEMAIDVAASKDDKLDNFDQLTAVTCDSLDKIISSINLNDYFRASNLECYSTTERHTSEAAAGGIATISAFLEVVPRVLAKLPEQTRPAEMEQIIIHSKGFIIEWMGVHPSVDYQLAYALAAIKPKNVDDVFDGLRFNPRYFIHDNGRVGLDPQRAPNLRGDNHRTHPANFPVGLTALFGCPARKVIPKIYDSMVERAASSGIIAASYDEERQNLGYL